MPPFTAKELEHPASKYQRCVASVKQSMLRVSWSDFSATLRLELQSFCRALKSPSDITAANIIHRIVHNRAAYEARNAKKNKSEAAYYKDKQHISEM